MVCRTFASSIGELKMDKKKRNILIAAAAGGVLTVGVAVMLLVSRPDADIMQKENGSYIINTYC